MIFMLSTFNCLVRFSVFIHLLKYFEADLKVNCVVHFPFNIVLTDKVLIENSGYYWGVIFLKGNINTSGDLLYGITLEN